MEDYLHLKYIQAISSTKSPSEHLLPPSMMRYVYFQKQAVVGEAFSLLSIGDSSTGYNVDLEFALIGNGVRKYFDEGNACVIPLTLEQLAGVGPICALSQTGDINRMLDLHFRKELVVRNPAEVVNGLTLYVHALCDKGQSPSDVDSEDAYGESFCRAFLTQCQTLMDSGQDPLRFVLSFVRSHYAMRSMLAAAAVAQMLIEISAYAPDVWDTELGRSVSGQLALLMCEAVSASLDDEAQAGDGLVAVCWLAAFLADPTEAPNSAVEGCSNTDQGEIQQPSRRIRRLRSGEGYNCQVLGKRRQVQVRHVCAEVARCMRRCAEEAAPWQRVILATACEPLERAQSLAAITATAAVYRESGLLRAGVEGMVRDAERGDMACEMLLGCRGGALLKRMDAGDMHAVARLLLECAPAEQCGALSGLVVKTAAAAGIASQSAAREAIKLLQQRKYACMCVQLRPRKCTAWQVQPKPEAASGRGCGACGALGQAMQRLLLHVVGGSPSAGRRSPDSAAPPTHPAEEAACRSHDSAEGSVAMEAALHSSERVKAPAAPSATVAPPHRHKSRPWSPPEPPPGPTTAASPGDAAGPPPCRRTAAPRWPSPSPLEPHGGRSPSPDVALSGPVSPPLQACLPSAGRRGSS